MIIENKKFLVYGIGKTGKSLAKFILKNGGRVAVYDKKITELPEDVKNLNIENRIGQKKKDLLTDICVVILSPGISVYDDVVKYAISQKVLVMSEMDFSFTYLKGVKIGITASGGKSTTTKLIAEILSQEFEDVRIGGNYGIPICDICENSTPKTISVLEISSFMLESSRKFHFDVGVFANISKNHLDRHKTMKKYLRAKSKIAKNMTSADVVIIPSNNEKILNRVKVHFNKMSSPTIVKFSRVGELNQEQQKEKPQNRIENSWVYVCGNKIIETEKFKVCGKHNQENLLISCIVAKHFGISDKNIENACENFRPLPHRFEKVCEKNGVTFINDSKATSGKSAETTVEMIDFPCVLMLGGSEKADEFYDLFTKIKNNKYIIKSVLYGAVVQKLQSHAKAVNYHNYQKESNFKSAFVTAKSLCTSGGVVLLSPACPSFDEFKNFEERGNEFKKLAMEARLDEK